MAWIEDALVQYQSVRSRSCYSRSVDFTVVVRSVLTSPGWDQTGSNGANLSFPQEFGIDGEGRDEWIVGLINSIIFLTAGCM